MKIVVDTSILIDFTRGEKTEKGSLLWMELVNYAKSGKHQLIVPSLAIFEFFSGKEMENSDDIEKAEDLLKDTFIEDLDEKIAKKAADLYRKHVRNIGVVDYVLAATSIVDDGELATLNSKHFSIFEDLKLFDFKKLDKV